MEIHRATLKDLNTISALNVHVISVQPEYQRKGFGGALVQQVRELAREKGIDTITLSVWFFNDQSRNFFRGQGFEVFNERMWLRKVN